MAIKHNYQNDYEDDDDDELINVQENNVEYICETETKGQNFLSIFDISGKNINILNV